ncbi:SDR family NAD(P)-dependent oxidoreductase [Micromonospora sp. SCSIO 07396]
MNSTIEGKSVIVTGASRGIGLAVARACVAQGALVFAGARTVGDDLRSVTPYTLQVDLAHADGPAALVDLATRTAGGVDVLVNNVGAAEARPGGFLSIGDADWQWALDVNFFSAVRATRAALPSLIERQGSIVTVGSVNSRRPDVNVADYSAAKAALTNLSKALAEEFGPVGVRINTVSPGPVSTDVWTGPDGIGAAAARAAGITQSELIARLPALTGISTGALTTPAEVADLVVYLAGRSANISGADLVIDGGLLKTV